MLMLGVFALSVYIGLYDKLLSQYQPLHWDINWVLAAASLVAAILLIGFSKNISLVSLGGIVWPIIYVIALGVDVYTRLCIDGNQAYCWPSKTAAFDYLILNNPNISSSYGNVGWRLWSGTMPTVLALLAIAFILSIVSVYSLRKEHVITTSSSVAPRPAPASPSQPTYRAGSQCVIIGIRVGSYSFSNFEESMITPRR